MLFIIVDKSYLDGTSAVEVQKLAQGNKFVVSSALFHEILTTNPKSRIRCLSKLPQSNNPVELFERIGNLVNLEMDNHAPAGYPSANLITLSDPFCLNPKLLNPDFVMPPESIEAIEEMRIEVDYSIEAFISLSETVPNIFPELTYGSTEQRNKALSNAQSIIADPRNVAGFLANLESPDPARPFPDASESPEKWATVVLLQVRLLFVTNLYVRYQGKVADIMTPLVRIRIEHDIHDAEVLALAVLEGAFATRERKLRDWFQLLSPNGHLFPE